MISRPLWSAPVTDAPWGAGVSVVGFDGDDTLWHSEDSFARTQEHLVELLGTHGGRSEILGRLQAVEDRNRELFGYGVKGFILSAIETAIDLSDGAIAVGDIRRLLDTAREMLSRPVELLPGVAEALSHVSASGYRVVLVTKGDLINQESKLARSGLVEMFEDVNIVSEKNADTYRRILRRLGVAPEEFLMVGNSEASDVQPVVSLGGWAALVPYPLTSLYELTWVSDRSSPRLRTLSRIDELPALLAAARSQAPSD
jgi:putative hydrolase of the HAD superfamily